MLELLLKLV